MYWVYRVGVPEILEGASEEWTAYLADLYPECIYFFDGAEG